MALVQCAECRQPVSDEAGACPQCGHILKEEKSKFWAAALAAFPIALSLLSVSVVILDHLSQEKKEDVDIAKTYWEAVSDSKSVAKIILTLNYTKHLLQKNLVDPNLALKTCLFLSDDQAADSKVKQEAGETLVEIRKFPSVAACLDQDRRLRDDVRIHIVAFSPRLAAKETQQLLSEIPKANSPDAGTSRQSAKQAIEQASELANGDASRAITGAGLSGLIENQSARAKALEQVSRFAVANPAVKDETLQILDAAIKTTENVSAKNQIQETIAQICQNSAAAPTPGGQSTHAPPQSEQPTPASTPNAQSTPPDPSEQPAPLNPSERPTPAPTLGEQSIPAATPSKPLTPTPTLGVRRAQPLFSVVVVYAGQARESDAQLCKGKLEALGTPSRLDDTTKLKGLNPDIPSKLEVRYSDPNLERQVQTLLVKCQGWLGLDGLPKLLPSRLVDTDTIEVWLPR
jgi:hypothetical protein